MPLPTIPNPTPVVIPARAELPFNERYIVRLVLGIDDAQGQVQPLRVTLRPYNAAQQLLFAGDETRGAESLDECQTFDNVWELAYAHPATAQAMAALVSVISLEIALRPAEAAVVAAQEAVDTATEETLAEATAALADATAARDAILSQLGA